MRKIVIHHRSPHHASYSGYARLIDYLTNVEIVTGKTKFPYSLAKLMSSFANQNSGFYGASSILKETELYNLIKNNSDKKAIHYLNAERDIRYVVKNKSRFINATFCGTFHKPPLILENQVKNTRYLKKLDAAIAVGSNQVEFLKNWLDLDNVKYIPHGVDTLFFKPNESKRENNTLLFVGQHLRDFAAFNYCVPKIAMQIKGLKVNVILRKEYNSKIKPHASVQLYNGIDDAALKNFYQQASLLFLPLTDVTACNSILEAMACGLSIITTDVGGNATYLSETNNILTPIQDYDYLIEATIDLLRDESKRLQLQKESRDKALSYDWSLVAKKINDFYNKQT